MLDKVNIGMYHDVFAQSIREVIRAISVKDVEVAKKIIIHDILYAYTNYKIDKNKGKNPLESIEEIKNDIAKMNLESKDWEELLIVKTTYQSLVGIKPIQKEDDTAQTFKDIAPQLSGD